jgi:hypothetical protein
MLDSVAVETMDVLGDQAMMVDPAHTLVFIYVESSLMESFGGSAGRGVGCDEGGRDGNAGRGVGRGGESQDRAKGFAHSGKFGPNVGSQSS